MPKGVIERRELIKFIECQIGYLEYCKTIPTNSDIIGELVNWQRAYTQMIGFVNDWEFMKHHDMTEYLTYFNKIKPELLLKKEKEVEGNDSNE